MGILALFERGVADDIHDFVFPVTHHFSLMRVELSTRKTLDVTQTLPLIVVITIGEML